MKNINMQLMIKICSALLMALLTNQCANKTLMSEYILNATYYEYGNLRPSDFQNEIERLQKFVQKTSETPETAKARLQLAFLYSHYRNPSPDYSRALEQLEKYVRSEPRGGKQDYVQNWLRMLKEISAAVAVTDDLKGKLEQTIKEAARIEKENAGMKEKLEQLKHLDVELEQMKKDAAGIEKENTEIKKKLEQLKHLDIELEQKRKLVK